MTMDRRVCSRCDHPPTPLRKAAGSHAEMLRPPEASSAAASLHCSVAVSFLGSQSTHVTHCQSSQTSTCRDWLSL